MHRHAITLLSTYADLHKWRDLAADPHKGLNFVVVIGRGGIGKSRAFRDALGTPGADYLLVQNYATAWGLYTQLWEHRELPIALVDDVDHLFRTKGAVSLLKCLCQTETTKTISWVSGMTNRDSSAPAQFATSMRLTVLANDLSPLEANLTALLDRAYVLEFRPSNDEIHRQVGTWFGHSDHERPIYQFIGENLPLIPALSMRDYAKARDLSEHGMDWRDYLQGHWLNDPKLALVARLLADPTLPTTTDRVRRFMAAGGGCRRTYMNYQAQLRHLQGEP